MNKQKLNIRIKEIDSDKRVLRFIGSNEMPDRDNDVIMSDGWDLKNYKANPVFLWAHSYQTPPIGKAVKVGINKATRELSFDIQFPKMEEISSDPRTPSEHALLTDTVYNMYRLGYMSAVSVGFLAKEYERRTDNTDVPEYARGMKIKKAELMELSAVPVPANPGALMDARKSKAFDTTGLDLVEKYFGTEKTTEKDANMEKELETIKEEFKTAFEEMKKSLEELKPKTAETVLEADEPNTEKAGATLSKSTIKKINAIKELLTSAVKACGDLVPDEDEEEKTAEPEGEKTAEATKTDEIDLESISLD